MHHNILEIFLFLFIVVVVAKLAGWASTKIGQPAVLGEILAGLLLGPTLIGIASLPIFPESHEQTGLYNKQRAVIEEVAAARLDRGESDNEQAESNEEEIKEEILGTINAQIHDAVISTDELNLASGHGREVIADAATHGLTGILEDRKSFLEDVVKFLAELGVLFLMFMAGIETDLVMMKRVGKTAFWAAVGGVIVPFILGILVTLFMVPHTGIYTAIFAGTILCATSVSISAQTLKELGALRSKEGTTILGAAVIDDVLGIILLSLVIAFNPNKIMGSGTFPKMYDVLSNWITTGMGLEGGPANVTGIIVLIVSMTLFFVAFTMFGIAFFERILSWAGRLPVSEPKVAFAIGLALLFAWAAEYIGAVAAITGTYLAGVLIGQTSHRHEIESKIGIVTYGFFVPIFFINIGLEANARTLGGGLLWYTIMICIVAIVGKIIGCLVASKFAGFNFIESLRVGIGMVSRGEVGLIVASVGLSAALISKDIFSVMIVMVLVTTLVTPVLLRFVFPRKGKNDEHPSHSIPADQVGL